MPGFLPLNRSGSTIAIGVCDRCKMKVQLAELRPDGNSPGLMVCKKDGCYDVRDPWRGPQRQTEVISLRRPRPDVQLISPAVWVDVTSDITVWRNNLNEIVDWMPI